MKGTVEMRLHGKHQRGLMLPSSATSGQSAQTKTTPEGVASDYLVSSYAFLIRATPVKPIRPEPNNQMAAGIGIDVWKSTDITSGS